MKMAILSMILISGFTGGLFAFEGDTARASSLKPSKYPDQFFPKENARNKEPFAAPALREADVMWSKRVWRVIDLREKMNHPLYYPEFKSQGRISLFDLIVENAKNGNVTCFDNAAVDDEFRYDMSIADVEKKLAKVDSQFVEGLDGEGGELMPVIDPVTSSEVWKYWVKEDWFFDKQRSVLEVRIIGICPLVEKISESGEHLGGDVPLFWIYFPEARPVLASTEVFIRKNDAQQKTFDDVFGKRMFSSYVRKESNVYDRGILDYKVGLDALLEAERVKNEIFTFEHDLFHF